MTEPTVFHGPTVFYERPEKVIAARLNAYNSEARRVVSDWCRGSFETSRLGHVVLIIPNSTAPFNHYVAKHGDWIIERKPNNFVVADGRDFNQSYVRGNDSAVATTVAELKTLPLNTCGVDSKGHYWIKHARNRWHCSCDGVSVEWSSKKMWKELQLDAENAGTVPQLTILRAPYDEEA